MILAGDIGGTKTNLAFFSEEGGRLISVTQESFPSKDYPSLEAVVREFAGGASLSEVSAAFGVAGPVLGGRCEATNLPWVIDARALESAFGLKTVAVINDIVVTAYGIAALKPEELSVLNEGEPQPGGNMALIAAGTGLGQAILFWDGRAYRASASEGGHTDLAPRNALEIELLQYLLTKFGRVSYERVLSGPGIVNIYSFLKEAGHGQEPEWLAEKLQGQDPSVVITEVAMRGECDLCVKTLHLFVSLYGAEAGNLALKAMATGGLYIGGGIAPKVLDWLRDGTFMAAFTDKGRLSPLLRSMPVRVILNEKTALLGAAQYAALERSMEAQR
ncbi:MAG: glucokinase [Candidatus Methylomirabilales bacterium]